MLSRDTPAGMIRFVALAASALALTFTAPVSGALQLYTKDAVDDLDMYELRGPPLRRLMQGALPVTDMGVGVGDVRIDAVTDIGVDAIASLLRCSVNVEVVMSQGQGTPRGRACRVRCYCPRVPLRRRSLHKTSRMLPCPSGNVGREARPQRL